MKGKEKRRVRRQDLEAKRGKWLALIGVTASVVYWGMLLLFVLAGKRWGGASGSPHLVASLAAGAVFVGVTVLAVGAFRGHPVHRGLYLALMFLWAMLGFVWSGFQLAKGGLPDWWLFDLGGIAVAIYVSWVFVGAKNGRAFMKDQEFNAKRT